MSESVVKPKSIKVLHLIDSGGLYGAEKMLLALVEEQVKQGLQPMILSVGDIGVEEKPLELEAKRLGLPLKAWRMKPGLNVRGGWKIISWAKSNDIAILHSHGYKFNLLVGGIPKFIRKLPTLTTVHGYVKATFASKMWLNQLVDRIALRLVEKVVYVDATAVSVKKTDSDLKINKLFIPNGIKIEKKVDDVAEKSRSPIKLLAIGRLSAEKNFSILIEAVQELRLKGVEAVLSIYGEGPMRASLNSEIESLGLENCVTLAGFTDQITLKILENDVLIMPSLTEGMPITILEAMQFNIPIIATSVGSIPYMLDYGRCGTLIDAGDMAGLVEALELIINNYSECLAKAELARLRVGEAFSVDYMADQYYQLYLGMKVGA